MFTGIVAAVGRIETVSPLGDNADAGVRLSIDSGGLPLADVALGDSIAIQGACMTVVAKTDNRFEVDVSRESLSKTVGLERPGEVNLEKALRLADRLDGHLVSGHVDGVGRVVAVEPDARSQRWTFEVPAQLSRYIASKGSVCIDGTSLTVNEVNGNRFGVNLIPHTVEHTVFHARKPGDAVNIEVDVVARYVERLIGGGDTSRIDEAFLKQHGFA